MLNDSIQGKFIWGFSELLQKVSSKVKKQSLNIPKTKLVSCWAVLMTFSRLTSRGDILLGKPKDFKAFHNSFGLPMHFIIKIIFLCT